MPKVPVANGICLQDRDRRGQNPDLIEQLVVRLAGTIRLGGGWSCVLQLNRNIIKAEIVRRLDKQSTRLVAEWQQSAPINHFVIDDLLPEPWAHSIRAAFPEESKMSLKSSLRELKYVTAQMDKYPPILEEAIYAFQAADVVARVQEITGLRSLQPDEMLYAGGISMMGSGHFLNPHVDNSHDKFRQRYRVLNLLYYVSPDWKAENGANLELWPDGPTGKPLTVVSRFNRLVVMVTHQGSWHSVSKNVSPGNRCCVSNYYFSDHPVGEQEYFHVTSFRGRPDQRVRDLVLRGDIWLRMAIRKLFPKGIKENRHFYDKKN